MLCEKKILAYLQVSILIVATFAFAFVINIEFGGAEVSDDAAGHGGATVGTAYQMGGLNQPINWLTKRYPAGTNTLGIRGPTAISTPTSSAGSAAANTVNFGGTTYSITDAGTKFGLSIKNGQLISTKGTTWGNDVGIKSLQESKLIQESVPAKETTAQRAGFSRSLGATLGGIVVGTVYAVIASYAVRYIGGLIDKEGKYTLEINAVAAGVSTYVGMASGMAATSSILNGGGVLSAFSSGFSGIFMWHPYVFIAAVIIAAYTYLTSETTETKEQSVMFSCLSWQAPIGGDDCGKCNTDPLKPCSEYRCKSLGQACGIVNAGTTNEKCIWMNPHDVASPRITPDDSVLTEGYNYEIIGNGVKIVKEGGGCIDAFTPIRFGITTDEPSQCKIEYRHTTAYDQMGYYVGENNLYEMNHSQIVSLPGTRLVNSLYPDTQSDGNYNLYIRCRDGNGNGNKNAAEFAVSFCVDSGPDATPPQIRATSINSNSPVQYQIDNVSLLVYTNEPAHCRWKRNTDSDYTTMDNNMTCNSQIWQMNAQALYTCATILTGIKDRENNEFYFRCEDLSNNSMHQGYKFVLKGSQPLNILRVAPNETIGGNTNSVQVTLHAETDNGFNNGISNCFFSTDNSTYLEFFTTNANKHDQPLELSEGNYGYYIKCVDPGGNADEKKTEFSVVVDKTAPFVTRVYNENSKIKVLLDEEGSCKYSTQTCNFDFNQGIVMVADDSNKAHYAEWKQGQSYYIKCSDNYANIPSPNACSIVVRPAIAI